MPLRIKLPSKEKIIINGAVIENAGEATTIILHNKVDILRRKEVMREEDALTPSRRIYYTLQSAYLFKDERDKYLDIALNFIKEYEEAAPSASEDCGIIKGFIADDNFYDALRKTAELITHEAERLKEVGALSPDEKI